MIIFGIIGCLIGLAVLAELHFVLVALRGLVSALSGVEQRSIREDMVAAVKKFARKKQALRPIAMTSTGHRKVVYRR